MATYRHPVEIVAVDTIAYPTTISNEITEDTAPSIGNVPAYLLADGGTDNGVYVRFTIPKNYIGTPKVVVRGVVDGTPGASDVLAFGFRKRAVADNESADGTFDAEQLANATIGSSGLNYADEDLLAMLITLTGADYAVDDEVYGYVFIDASVNTYAGNFLLTSVELEYADA